VAIVRAPSTPTSETTVPVRPETVSRGRRPCSGRAPLRQAGAGRRRPVADEPRLAAQLADPGGDVRGLAAGPELGHRVRVRALGEWLREADDHVEQQVAEGHDHAYDPSMDGESRRSRTRSFLVGAAVGASAAIAAARRLRPKERKRETPAGLAAFEEAPCYRELVESERLAP
jgi:hypothetical protein